MKVAIVILNPLVIISLISFIYACAAVRRSCCFNNAVIAFLQLRYIKEGVCSELFQFFMFKYKYMYLLTYI